MEPGEHPTAFGLFKPVGHVVVALPRDADAAAVLRALAEVGLKDVVMLSSEQMIAQANRDLAEGSAIGSVGQEANLVKTHRDLAYLGNSFLVIKADDDDQVAHVTDIAQRFGATRAQRYGRLLIEELIEYGSNDHQTFESPDRGLDPQTRSGQEQGKAR